MAVKRVMLLNGPAGVGKTTVGRRAARYVRAPVIAWKNSTTSSSRVV
jgi:MoxR-like ATPase